jgi:16S rRNA (guanine966-N2)-methyltransferase
MRGNSWAEAMGSARIVAGKAKGRTLLVPKGVRPTSALSRRRILDSLEPLTRFARVLDLYAGSGVLSAELLSRGVGHLVAVELSRRVAAAWKKNMEQLGFMDRAKIMVKPVLTALRDLRQHKQTYDLILADPPYACDEIATVLHDFAWNDVLKEGGLLVLEQSARESTPRIESLTHRWSKRIGDTGAHAFERPWRV